LEIPSTPQVLDGQPIFHSRWVCSQHTDKTSAQTCPPFGAIDAQVYHCMIRLAKSRKIIEVGSGHSTYVAIEAVKHSREQHPELDSSLTCIEPYPAAPLRSTSLGIPFTLVDQPLQRVDPALFRSLGDGDILFIDSTHVVAPGRYIQIYIVHLN
jgi:hypothetical protein